MEITIQLPNDLTQHEDPAREALEALTIAGYRSGQLSHFQASKLLGLTRCEFDGFLKARIFFDHSYSAEDLEEDRKTMRWLEEQRKKTEGAPSS